jgi:UDP-N-acetylglucosamine acyltransferase
MDTLVHPTAVVDPTAELGEGVEVGPHAVIGAEVVIGAECEIGAGAQVQGPTTIGTRNRIFSHACVGFEPQDLKFGGERSYLEIGDGNTIREFATLHRGTELGGGKTVVGSDNLFMAYTHVAHDCIVGDRTIFGNASTLAGHVEVDDDAILSAFCAVHQFCRIGRHAYIGGYTVVTMDALPYAKTVGAKAVSLGINRIGLQRRGFDEERLKAVEAAYRTVVRSGLNTSDALEKLREDYPENEDVIYLVKFIEGTQRGILKTPPGRRGARGGAS